MKKLIIIGSAIMVFAACDKVKNPNQNPNTNSNCVVTPNIVKTNSLTSGYRKVLVEDYTGHTCGNCPKAARFIENIELTASFKDSMIVMAVHAGGAGGFAEPNMPDYPDEFRNEASNDWDVFLGMSVAGFPKVLVNRTPASPQAYSALNTLIPLNVRKPQSAKLDVTTYLDTAKLLLNVDVKTTFKMAYTNSVKLVLTMLEDSIIAHQKDYLPPVGTVVSTSDPDLTLFYVFNNMNRGAINGSWGDLVKAGPIAVNDTVTKKYTCFKVNSYNGSKKSIKNMSVLAFVYDDITKEILQAEKIKIK